MNLQLALDEAAKLLKGAKNVAILTGAGVSAESGVPTFRAADGLWEGHAIQEVATPRGFARDPELVWKFYNARRANVATVKPNPGHYALVALERHFGTGFTLITQNVDGLHRQAGSQNLLEIHGSLRRTRCTNCEEIRDQGLTELGIRPLCDNCGSLLRPDIVWFEEMLPPDIWRAAAKAAESADLFLSIGTSAVVHPAAGLIARTQGAVIECNLVPTEASDLATVGLYGPSGTTLPELCRRLEIVIPEGAS